MKPDPGKFENEQARNDPDVERLLDNALTRYAMAEPRPGLEGRILAQLATAREPSRRRLQWWPIFASGTAAALALALFFVGHLDQRLIPEAPVAKLAGTTAPIAAQKYGSHRKHRSGRPKDSAAHEFAGASRTDRPPKLEQFPSPLPLSEQERILVNYVAKYPETAALVAQARTEELEHDRKEEEAEAAQGSSE